MVTDAPTTPPANATGELGSQLSWFQPYSGVDPKTGDWVDFDLEFTARNFEEMLRRDGRAAAVARVLTLPLRSAQLTIKPAKGDTGEADFVNESLERMTATPMPLVIGQAAQSLIFRTTFLEKVFTVDRGVVEYDALAWRPPDSCATTRDRGTGRLTGFRQDLPNGAEPVHIPIEKAVLFMHGADVNPIHGTSEMQVTWRCYTDKQKIRALWNLLLERAAAPWVIAETQSGQEKSVAGTLAKMRGGGVAAVSGLKGSPTVLDVAGNAAELFEKALRFLDSEMAGSVLAGFLDLTSGAATGRGSYALSKDQTDFFTSSEDAAAREIASTTRTQIVTPLLRYNRGTAAVIPTVQLGPISGATTEQAVSLLQALASAPAGTELPAEFVDQLVVMVATKFDMDVDKIRVAISEATRQASTSPAAAVTAPVHAAVQVASLAARRAAPVEAAAVGL